MGVALVICHLIFLPGMRILNASKIDEIVSLIRAQSEQRSKLIVAIDGYSGAGKTSILDQIKRKLPVAAISLDNFVNEFPRRKECMKRSKLPEIEFPECWYRFDELIKVLTAFRTNRNCIAVRADSGQV